MNSRLTFVLFQLHVVEQFQTELQEAYASLQQQKWELEQAEQRQRASTSVPAVAYQRP